MAFYDRFLQVMPPDPNVERLAPEEVAALRSESMPEQLLTLYRDVGVGSFGGGVFWLSRPADLQPALDVWLPPSPRRIPFGRSAFGDLFYYRDMREEAQAKGFTGENPGELSDVSVVQVDFSGIAVCALSIEDLCDEILGFEDNVEGVFRGDLVRAATEIHGPLAADEQFGFAPMLAMGGAEDITCVRKVKLLIQTSILKQTGA